jgi:hypothetical protein
VAATQTANRVMHALREWSEDAEPRLATAADTADASAGRTVSGPWEAVVVMDEMEYCGYVLLDGPALEAVILGL